MIEFLIKMRDMASPVIKKFADTGQNSFGKVGEAMSKLSGRFNALGMNISQIDERLTHLQRIRAISFDSSQIRRINSEIDQLQNKKNRLEGGSRGGLGSMFRTGLALAGIGSLAYLGKDIMQAGISRQMDLTALQTLVGKTAGGNLNNKLIDFSIKSPYGGEVMNEGKLLAGSGVGAGKIPHLIQMMGDIALADKERMKSLALGFAEANTRGNLNGQVERMFIQGGLFNPIEQLHKMTGKSNEALKKDMQKGKISIDMLTQAMEYATGPLGRWHNAMKNAMETPAGKWTAFVGTVSVLAGNIGLKLLPALGGLTNVFNWIIEHGMAVAIGIGAMTAAWAAYTVVTKGAAIWSAILEAFTSPWLAIAGIGIATAAVAATFMDNSDAMANSAIGAANKIDAANKKITSSTDAMALKLKGLNEEKGGFWSGIGDWLGEAFKDIWYFIQKLIINIAEIGREIGQLFIGLGQVGQGNVVVGWQNIKKALIGVDPLNHFMDNLEARHDLHKKLRAAGKNDDGTPLDGVTGAGIPGGGAGTGGGGTLGGDTTDKITGGGVRNITINVMKPFADKVEIHSVNLKEGVQEIEEIFRDMFLRITNSAATAMS